MNIQEIKNTLSNEMHTIDVEHIMREILLGRFKEIIKNSNFIKLDFDVMYIVKKSDPHHRIVYFRLETIGTCIYTLEIILLNPSFKLRININLYEEDPRLTIVLPHTL